MLELGEETKLRWTRTPFRCPKRSFCCVCWWKQKQIHHPNNFLDSSWVSKPASTSRRRIWLWSWHGLNHSLWRTSVPVLNINAQIRRILPSYAARVLACLFLEKLADDEAASIASLSLSFFPFFFFFYSKSNPANEELIF